MKILLFAILSILSSNIVLSQSYISQLYCLALGNGDIKKEYKDIVTKALQEYGVVDAELISIKKMNCVGQVIARMPLSSFTAFGIWFDEDFLDLSSEEERTFQIYHEAAHYVQQHHQKTLISLAISNGAIAGFISYNKLLQDRNNSCSLPITPAITGIVAAAGIYLGMLPYIVKQQEKEADLQACRKLIALDRTDIIKARIKDLRRSGSTSGNIWWFSEVEQAEYLEKTIK